MADVPHWYTEFVGAVVARLPRDLDETTAARWVQDPAGLEEALRATFASGVPVAIAALKNDKSAEGWELLEDATEPARISGETIELVPILNEEDGYILGEEMVERTRALAGRLGQRHAEHFLDNPQEIPESFRQYSLIFPGTIWVGKDRNHHVPCLVWRQGQWDLQFGILEAGVDASDLMVRATS
jgi:hypothetical protein